MMSWGMRFKTGSRVIPTRWICGINMILSQIRRRLLSVSHTVNMSRIPETSSFKFNHTMIRIKDPKASLAFYQDVLGMELYSEKKFDDFTLYFLAYNHDGSKLNVEEKEKARFSREGVLELTHNHGTESDPNFKGYSSGNAEPGKGFGHIAITVDDVEKACERFEKLGVTFKKRLADGRMRHIAFILDPDGYWIEILPGVLTL